eukprot:COSAG02_NODE_1004_length_15275_cov_11.955917_5_plen_81_part_00
MRGSARGEMSAKLAMKQPPMAMPFGVAATVAVTAACGLVSDCLLHRLLDCSVPGWVESLWVESLQLARQPVLATHCVVKT